MSIKILIVDDEPDIIEFLKYNLERHGYTVFAAIDGKEAISAAIRYQPDLILLDIMMPGMDGIEVCRELRARPEFADTLIAFVTARSEDYSQIAGFEVGADDYIAKPIKPRILVARITALLKRKRHLDVTDKTKQYNDLIIDLEQRVIIVNTVPHHLPKKEYEIFTLLSSKPGKVFTREEIYGYVWGQEVVVSDRTIDVHIRKIREKLGDKYIKTIKGIGYKFYVK